MPKEWYEEDDNEPVWWKATKKNAHQACPVLFQDVSGFNENNWYIESFEYASLTSFAWKTGFKKSVSSFMFSASTAQWTGEASWLAHSYCIGALIGGYIDAQYQIKHNGRHMLSDKWDFDTQIMTNFLIKGYFKYQNDSQKVEFFLNNLNKWWKS